MASNSQIRARGTSRPKPSITSHPAFPFIVALWFAALLGLGSLILPPVLIEKLIVMSGLPQIVPAAEPPLGFTSRAMIALLCTLFGAGLGLLAARQVTKSTTREPVRASVNPAHFVPRQPLKAHEELGEQGLDGKPGSRRRSLALEEDSQPSEYLQVAPMPRYQSVIEDGDFEDLESETVATSTLAPAPLVITTSEPLELAGCEQEAPDHSDVEPAQATFVEPLSFSPPSLAPVPAVELQAADTFAPSAEEDDEPEDIMESVEVAQDEEVSQPTAEVPFEELGLVQLVQRLSTTIEKHREWNAQQTAAASTASAPAALAPVLPQAMSGAFGTAEADEAAKAMAAYFSAPETIPESTPESSGENSGSEPTQTSFENPAIGELPSAPDPDPTTQSEAQAQSEAHAESERQDFQAAVADEIQQSSQQLRPFCGLPHFVHNAEDDAEDDGLAAALAASFSLPASKKQAFAPVPAIAPASNKGSGSKAEHTYEQADDDTDNVGPDDTDTDGADEAPDTSYSSLLNLQNPFREQREEFVRINEPEPDVAQPAVVFPKDAANSGAASRSFDPPAAKGPTANGQAQPAPAASRTPNDEADRALRDALRNLQRMGKAG